MSPLISKEIRLLLPAFGMALLLAMLPVWIPVYDVRGVLLTVGLFGIGVVMLALSSFGREFSLRTFPMIMAQPIERRRLWWTKILVLAVAMATVFCVWSLNHHYVPFPSVHDYLDPNYPDAVSRREMFSVGGAVVAVATAGALWTTMLVRQVTAAFWLTILIPGAILTIANMFGGSGVLSFAALCVYAIAGFWLGWWQFTYAQETAWTGGVITLSGWRKANVAEPVYLRGLRPRRALLWKELQLHQVTLMGMAGLFVLHLAVVCLRKFGNIPTENLIRMAVDQFGGIWFIVPLVTAGLAVAEERRLGTIQGLLCLPIPSRTQFLIKFVVTILISGVLSAALLWTAESISASVGASGFYASEKGLTFVFSPDKNAAFNLIGLVTLALPLFPLSLIALYASTLARGIVQAIAAAIGTITAIAALFNVLSSPWNLFGVPLWRGALVHFITWPVLIVICIWLAFRNFKSLSENWLFWRRNLLAFASALVFTSITTTAIYNRVWELFRNPEPAHGPARLAGPYRPALRLALNDIVLAALLPDGRLWVGGISYDPSKVLLRFNYQSSQGETQAVLSVNSWHGFIGNHFVPGSNWVDATAGQFETIAIRSDGTLWFSEKSLLFPPKRNATSAEEIANPVRVGNGTQWKGLVLGSAVPMLLKGDGTLWKWRRRDGSHGDNWPEPDLEPAQVGTRSDWDRTLPCPDHLGFYAWRKDGKAWIVHPPTTYRSWAPNRPGANAEVLEPGSLAMNRFPDLDNTRWRSITSANGPQIGLREDGTLWHWYVTGTFGLQQTIDGVEQLGTDTDWTDLAGEFGMVALTKADGSLWGWNLSRWQGHGRGHWTPVDPPVRLSRHKDWLAVGYAEQGIVALAADGGLWHWWDQSLRGDPDNSFLPLPRPTRRPSFVENILDDQK